MRWMFISNWVLARCFAWCLLYSISWTMASCLIKAGLVEYGFRPECAVVRLALAFMVSIVAFCGIWTLDYISDHSDNMGFHYVIRNIIRSIGFLVGFCWEQAFNRGVESLSLLQHDMQAETKGEKEE